MPITFTSEDLKLQSYPHNDTMVITKKIAAWEISKVLIDTRSSTDILFLNIFDQMKLSRNQLHPPETPLYGFGGKRVNTLSKISLPVSFGDTSNSRTEYITFDVVDITTPTMQSSAGAASTNSVQ